MITNDDITQCIKNISGASSLSMKAACPPTQIASHRIHLVQLCLLAIFSLASYWHIKWLSSTLEASELVGIIGRKGKLDSAFSVRSLRILLLKHVMLMKG
jgi:hypothetical protein